MKAPNLSTVVAATYRDTFADVGYVRRASTSISPLVMGSVVLTEPFRRCVGQKEPSQQIINHTIIKKEAHHAACKIEKFPL